MSDNEVSGLLLPSISWRKDTVPESDVYGDVYFNAINGLEESSYNFLEGNNLPENWVNKERFVIGELGFGTGMNFFLTWKLWKETQKEKKTNHLHYISFEKFPLDNQQIKKAIFAWPELREFAEHLLPLLPARLQGFHRIVLPENNIYLTLVYGDANAMIEQLEAEVDAWFLDGFSPSKNPELWNESLFQSISACSSKRATCASFSSARVVKDALSAAGFSYELKKGYGLKRQMLTGKLVDKRVDDSRIPINKKNIKSVAVIGSGIAGSLTAAALSYRGLDVTVFEKGPSIACGTSGNAAGVITPYPTAAPSTMGEFFLSGHEFAWQQIQTFQKRYEKLRFSRCGVIRLSVNSQLKNLKAKLANLNLPEAYAYSCEAEELKKLSSLDISKEAVSEGGLYFPTGGWLKPAEYCEAALSLKGITVKLNTKVTAVSSGEKPSVSLADKSVHEFDTVVLANAFDASLLLDFTDFRFELTRGQLLSCKSTAATEKLSTVFCYDGYILPAIEGEHVIGATYDRENTTMEVIESQNAKLIQALSGYLDKPLSESGVVSSRVGMRSSAADRRPYVGEYFPNIYLNICHGSRGLVSAGLSGEQLASLMVQDPLPLGRELTRTLSPHRRSR